VKEVWPPMECKYKLPLP